MPTSNYSWQDHLCLNILSWNLSMCHHLYPVCK
jgi:hypothetical protein